MVIRILAMVVVALTSSQAIEAPTPLSELAMGNLNQRWKEANAQTEQLLRKLYVDGYDAHGKHGPWDDVARKALEAQAKAFPNPMIVQGLLRSLVATKCTDPLIRYRLIVDRQLAFFDTGIVQSGVVTSSTAARPGGVLPSCSELMDIADALCAAGYSPLIVQGASSRCAFLLKQEDCTNAALMKRLLDRVSQSYVEVAQDVGADATKMKYLFFNSTFTSRPINSMLPPVLAMRFFREQIKAVEAALAHADPWWQDAVIGGLHARMAELVVRAATTPKEKEALAEIDATQEQAEARTRLERAALLHPDRVYPFYELMWLATLDRPQELRHWFEAALRADPVLPKVIDRYIGALSMGPDPVKALLEFATEASRVNTRNSPLGGSCLIHCVMRMSDLSSDRDALWSDLRMWPILNKFTGDVPQLQSERLVYAWRCNQREEAVRLWQEHPKFRVAPPVLLMTGATPEKVAADCAIWAAAAPSEPAASPAPKTNDF